MSQTGADPSLNVVIISQEELFYLPCFFERFLDRVDDPIRISAVYLTTPFDEGLFDLIGRGLQLYGYLGFLRRGTDFALRKLAAALGWYNSVANLCRQHGLSVIQTEDVNRESTVEDIRAYHPDVLLSVSAAQVFSDELLEVPSWGSVNIHSSKLPEYRGMMPNFWAMYYGDDTAGITVHTMSEEIDLGQVLMRDEVPIEDDDTLDTLIKRSKRRGAEMAVEVLERIHTGTVEPQEMTGQGTYHSFPSYDDVQIFRERGNRLI